MWRHQSKRGNLNYVTRSPCSFENPHTHTRTHIQYSYDEVIDKNARDSEFIYMVVKVTPISYVVNAISIIMASICKALSIDLPTPLITGFLVEICPPTSHC